ncbi:MAG: tol-pal system protein YbgF [Thermodesulfobacteriota bacterium]
MKKAPLYIAAAALALTLPTGCGPGFPIVTAEQDTLKTNVDSLMRKTPDLERRLAAIEGIKGGLGTAAAQASADIEVIREDLAKLRGTIEEKDYDIEQVNEKAEALAETLGSIEGRLSSIEEKMQEDGTADEWSSEPAPGEVESLLEPVKADIEAIKNSLEAIEEALGGLDERLAAVEAGSVAEVPQKDRAPDPANLYMEGYRETMDNRNYPAGREIFKRFLSLFPEHELADNAQYWLGEIYYAEGDWERAVLEFNKVIKDYPDGDKVAAAKLKQAFSFNKLGADKEARVLLEQIIEKFPAYPEAEHAKKRLEEMDKPPAD